MSAPLVVGASRRAVLAATTAAATVCSASWNPCRPFTTRTPVASASTRPRTPKADDSRPTSRRTATQRKTQPGVHSPASSAPTHDVTSHKKRFGSRPGSNGRAPPAPSASDLLSELHRTSRPLTASSSSSSRPRPRLVKNNSSHQLETDDELSEAARHVVFGLAGRRRDFERAFYRGWIPLRRAGQVSRIPPDDLGKLVQAAAQAAASSSAESRRTSPAAAGSNGSLWQDPEEDVRELILYAAGERDARPVTEWAWKTLELGWVGAERVRDVWEAIRTGRHLALRSGPDAPDDPATTTKPSAQLVAAAVVADLLLRERSAASSSPARRSILPEAIPQWVSPHIPRLDPLLARGILSNLIERHVHPSAYPDAAAAAADMMGAVRQVALAQMYYARRGAPALEVLVRARELFRTGRATDAWQLWEDVARAVETEGWMGTERWVESGTERKLPGDVAQEEDGGSSFEAAAATAEPTDVPSFSALAPPPPAQLHQALVATFLAGFIQAQATDQAHALWSWLLSRTPPLTPGPTCWTGLLHGYAPRGQVPAVEAAFADLAASAAGADLWAWLERIDAHFVARRPDDAMRLASEMMRDRTVLARHGGGGALPEEAWNRLMSGLLSNGRRVEAEALLDEMQRAGVPPSIVTVNGFLRAFTTTLRRRGSGGGGGSSGGGADLAAVVRVLQLLPRYKLQPDVFTFTMVLQALLASGLKDATARTIAIMEQAGVKPTATTYGTIIHDLVQGGGATSEQLDAAVQLLDEMEAKRIPTNEVIYTSLIQGFLGAIPSTPVPAVTAVAAGGAAAAAAAGLDPATRAQHPYLVAALTLKHRMEKRGLRLNRIGYNAFLAASLARQSDWGTEFALRLFDTLQHERTTPTTGATTGAVTASDTWYVLLDGLVRMGDFGRADAVVQEMRRQGFEVRNRGLQRLVDQIVRGRR